MPTSMESPVDIEEIERSLSEPCEACRDGVDEWEESDGQYYDDWLELGKCLACRGSGIRKDVVHCTKPGCGWWLSPSEREKKRCHFCP